MTSQKPITFAFRSSVAPLTVIQTISSGDSIQPIISRAAVRDFAAKMSRFVHVVHSSIQNRKNFTAVDICVEKIHVKL